MSSRTIPLDTRLSSGIEQKLTDFFTFGLESVTAQPLVNAEAGEYSVSVRCSIGPFSNEEITTFSITVLELPEVEEVTETTETTTTIDSIEIPVFRPPEE